MTEEIAIDFFKASEDECIEFAKKVNSYEIEDPLLKNTFDYYNKINYMYEPQAITLIKNLVLTQCYVNCLRTDYRAYSGRVLLTVAENDISGNGSVNLKILRALFKSQFQNEIALKDDANKKILEEIMQRFECITENEKDEIKYMKSTFSDYFSGENKFGIEYYIDSD